MLQDDLPNDFASLQALYLGQRREIQSLKDENELLRVENAKKDTLISSLRKKLEAEAFSASGASAGDFNPLKRLSSSFSIPDEVDAIDIPKSINPLHTQESFTSVGGEDIFFSSSFDVREAVEDIQRWLFMDGGHLINVQELLCEYSIYVRDRLQVPLDRLFVGGLMLHPQMSAYVWKWEHGCDFDEHEIPREAFEKRKKLFSKDEPFIVLMDNRAPSVRMRASDTYFPPDCKWFVEQQYQDYLALPILHRGKFLGGMAWCTKESSGFSADHIEFFKESLAALTTTLRVHTNDLVLRTLKSRLEDEINERTKDLAKANKQILEQSAAQLRHFAMMSHEIRTPLNCIVGMSSLLMTDPSIESSHKESLRMITRSGDLLVSVVNDVLDYSRLESGAVEIKYEPTDFSGIIDLVVHSMSAKARTRKVTIEKTIETGFPSMVQMDGSRLQQVLYNILGNAVKFSKEDSVVEFSTRLLDKKDTTLNQSIAADQVIEIVVKDYGKGIAQNDIKCIFEPFNQGNEEDGRIYGGTGLGLAITSRLVKALGGSISAESELGSWSTFTVLLPCNEAVTEETAVDDTQKNPQSPIEPIKPNPPLLRTELLLRSDSLSSTLHSQSSDSAPPRTTAAQRRLENGNIISDDTKILVVDDNAINRKVLLRMLSRMGAKDVETAEDGLEACEKEETTIYDVILMDMEMPVMGGLEATRRILDRDRGEVDPPKIVFVTAHALNTFHQQAIEAGGVGFVAKPFNLKKLKAMFESLELDDDLGG